MKIKNLGYDLDYNQDRYFLGDEDPGQPRKNDCVHDSSAELPDLPLI